MRYVSFEIDWLLDILSIFIDISSFPILSVISVKLDVRMPNIPAVEGINEIYLCTSVRLPEPDKTLFATRFDPKVSKNNVHHMVLYGISEAQILRNGTFFFGKIKIHFTNVM